MRIFNGSIKRGLSGTAILLALGLMMIAVSFESPTRAKAAVETTAPAFCLAGDCTYGPDTCVQGYVWREADSRDHVCVVPAMRRQVSEDNRLTKNRYAGGGDYGPYTCKQGFVWREAFPGDVVCVTPEIRTQTKLDNGRAARRRSCRR